MKRTLLIESLLACTIVLATMPSRSSAASQCIPAQKSVIDSEARCFPAGGIDIGYLGDEGVKVACMRDERVRSVCGPDGRVTRLHAYQEWFTKLKDFESQCSAKGGTPRFEDPMFSEPVDESFCVRAQPEVGSNMFESALCNYRAVCPSIVVVCDFACSGGPSASALAPAYSLPETHPDYLRTLVANKRSTP